MSLLRRLGNRLITATYNVLFRQHITDLCTGLKGLRRDAFALAALRKNGFEHAMELAALIALSGEQIYEVPVHYSPRVRGRSKMRHLREASKFLVYLTTYWFRGVVLRRPLSL
jgi:hypothetical protein